MAPSYQRSWARRRASPARRAVGLGLSSSREQVRLLTRRGGLPCAVCAAASALAEQDEPFGSFETEKCWFCPPSDQVQFLQTRLVAPHPERTLLWGTHWMKRMTGCRAREPCFCGKGKMSLPKAERTVLKDFKGYFMGLMACEACTTDASPLWHGSLRSLSESYRSTSYCRTRMVPPGRRLSRGLEGLPSRPETTKQLLSARPSQPVASLLLPQSLRPAPELSVPTVNTDVSAASPGAVSYQGT